MWSREWQELDIAVDLQMQKGQKMHICSIFTLVFWAFWGRKSNNRWKVPRAWSKQLRVRRHVLSMGSSLNLLSEVGALLKIEAKIWEINIHAMHLVSSGIWIKYIKVFIFVHHYLLTCQNEMFPNHDYYLTVVCSISRWQGIIPLLGSFLCPDESNYEVKFMKSHDLWKVEFLQSRNP